MQAFAREVIPDYDRIILRSRDRDISLCMTMPESKSGDRAAMG